MRKLTRISFLFLLAVCLTVPAVQAYPLTGTVLLNPGDTVSPGLATGSPGALLDFLSVPWVSSLGTASGTLVSAVFQEAGTGTLDFYYQVTNNTTATNCGGASQPACDPLSRETDTDFSGFLTSVGFRIDGASLPGGHFIDGTVAPVTADRNCQGPCGPTNGNVVGFAYTPPDSSKIHPGEVGNVLVISTNATNYTRGFASVIDGGVTTVAAFQPAAAVPEPVSFLLYAGGFIMLGSIRRFRRR
jgi:hypothetical protein